MKTSTNKEPKLGFDIGNRIRDLRQQKRWTLEALADSSGLSISAISKIENGRVSTSFDTLVKIARGLDIPVAGLFGAPEPPAAANLAGPPTLSARRVFTRRGEGTPFSSDYYDYEVHSNELLYKGMIPLVMRVRTRVVPRRSDWSVHDGEEFIYVTKGELVLYSAFYSALHMKAGDSAYIDSTMGHAFVSVGEGDAEMLSICMTERLNFNDVIVGMPADE
jgi:transcriptional regulator with XRE-family HTH domain